MSFIRQVIMVVVGLLLTVFIALFVNQMYYLIHPTITRAQQDNIVRKLARCYYITDVEFKEVVVFLSASNRLNIRLNQNDKYYSSIRLGDESSLNKDKGIIMLGPVGHFPDIEKDKVDENEPVDLSHIHIKYLEE